MIKHPSEREDFSRFLVHLTRKSDDNSAMDNLINIIKTKTIEARNHHCLFSYDFKRLHFSDVLIKKFRTVCFTEVPLHQIKHLAVNTNRKISFEPYGLVFWKSNMFDIGASPAIYINSSGNQLKNYLLEEFRNKFKDIKLYKNLKKVNEHYAEVIQYYSLINIVEPEKNNDFMWQREWRINKSFKFKFYEIVGIVASDPEEFIKRCEETITNKNTLQLIKKTPIIDPNWSYEEMFEAMAFAMWKK